MSERFHRFSNNVKKNLLGLTWSESEGEGTKKMPHLRVIFMWPFLVVLRGLYAFNAFGYTTRCTLRVKLVWCRQPDNTPWVAAGLIK